MNRVEKAETVINDHLLAWGWKFIKRTQSTFSKSLYITWQKNKKLITLRLSDHKTPDNFPVELNCDLSSIKLFEFLNEFCSCYQEPPTKEILEFRKKLG